MAQGQEVSLAKASEVFASLPGALQIPSLHPKFAEVDSLRDVTAEPVYWVYEGEHGVVLRSFLMSSISVGTSVVRDIQSPYGGGGILVSASDVSFRVDAAQQFRHWAIRHGVVVEFLRLHPLLDVPKESVEDVWPNRRVVVVPLQRDIFEGYKERKRLYVKNELATEHELVQLGKQDGFTEFLELYTQNMRAVGARREYFFSHSYLSELLDCPFAQLWGLKYGGDVVAVALLLHSLESRVVEYHLGASLRPPGRRPMELLLHLLASTYQQLGYEVFLLGGGRTTAPTDSLLRFKKSFSNMTRTFSIGRNVFLPEKYTNIQGYDKFSEQRKVLFYRANLGEE